MREQIEYAIRGSHRYLLKRVVKANIAQLSKPDVATENPAAFVEKVQETTNALAIIQEERGTSALGQSLGLNTEEMKALFNEALRHARDTAKRTEIANLATLAIGLLLVVSVAFAGVIRESANEWTFATGGMGAAAAIAALITSPGRRMGSGTSKLMYTQTAYFAFLTQVRILNAPGPESSLERSERLQQATSAILSELKGAIEQGT